MDARINQIMFENGQKYIFPRQEEQEISDEERSLRQRTAATVDLKLDTPHRVWYNT